MQRADEALTLARALSHPFSLGFALNLTIWLHVLQRDVPLCQELTEATATLAMEHGFALFDSGSTITRGWTLAMQGQVEEGIDQMRQGLAAQQATGMKALQFYLVCLADMYRITNQTAEGFAVLDEAQALVGETAAARWFEAEILRLRGELLRIEDCGLRRAELTPEDCFHKALSIAQSQQAKSWELRAATSLARLWQSQSKRQDAYDLLAPVYGWFTEGFDTADLKDAKALLNDLAEHT